MIFVLIILVLGIVLITWMLYEAHRNVVKIEDISLDDFPSGFGRVSLFFISDIHRRKIADSILEQVKTHEVDMIIIGGDLTEKGVPMSKVRENLENLRRLAPVYFVWGNNDYETDYRELDALLIDCGIKVLDNTAVSFESEQGDLLFLVGVDDGATRRDDLKLALLDCEQNAFKILVSHDPRILRKIPDHANIGLILSGHTHGGQIRLGRFGPYEVGQIHKKGPFIQLISNGYGTTGVPLRLGARAETHIINITSSQFSSKTYS
ncbi:metallophosphoesterase [Bacillus sp. HMF5848]|uniref:metallophosphoesterase n=1 Tax=Bacillus sp. HMF5848 TaxID=2495421 RepID=UPI000F7BA0E3|nr:metallophosphoesterase [Bacillus sp. HMF5848]RSK27461.1 metallophosphoesterase [Bacillus sp. HMF5848]